MEVIAPYNCPLTNGSIGVITLYKWSYFTLLITGFFEAHLAHDQPQIQGKFCPENSVKTPRYGVNDLPSNLKILEQICVFLPSPKQFAPGKPCQKDITFYLVFQVFPLLALGRVYVLVAIPQENFVELAWQSSRCQNRGELKLDMAHLDETEPLISPTFLLSGFPKENLYPAQNQSLSIPIPNHPTTHGKPFQSPPHREPSCHRNVCTQLN